MYWSTQQVRGREEWNIYGQQTYYYTEEPAGEIFVESTQPSISFI